MSSNDNIVFRKPALALVRGRSLIGWRAWRRLGLPTTARFGRCGELVFGRRHRLVVFAMNRNILLMLWLPIRRCRHSFHLLVSSIHFSRAVVVRLLNRCCWSGHWSTIVFEGVRCGGKGVVICCRRYWSRRGLNRDWSIGWDWSICCQGYWSIGLGLEHRSGLGHGPLLALSPVAVFSFELL
jgi:hypothetical protein